MEASKPTAAINKLHHPCAVHRIVPERTTGEDRTETGDVMIWIECAMIRLLLPVYADRTEAVITLLRQVQMACGQDSRLVA